MPNEDKPGMAIADLRSVIGEFKSLKDDPSVDKKWLNKIVARLEEVEAFGVKLFKPNSINNPANFDSLASSAPLGAEDCECLAGLRVKTCPIHGDR